MNRRGFMKLLALTPLAGLLKPEKALTPKLEVDNVIKPLDWPEHFTRESMGWKSMMVSKILNNDPVIVLNVTSV